MTQDRDRQFANGDQGPLFGPESDPTYVGPPRPKQAQPAEATAAEMDAASASGPDELGDLEGSQAISQRHREIIRLAFLGRTNVEIAERMSMDRASIGLILRSPLAQAELARMNAKAEAVLVNTPLRVALDKDLRDAATESLRLNRAILADPKVDMRVRSKTAQHFMDRIIFSEGPNEQETSYRDILRRLDAIDRNVRLNGSGVALFPPGSLKDILEGEEVRDGGSGTSPGASGDPSTERGGAG